MVGNGQTSQLAFKRKTCREGQDSVSLSVSLAQVHPGSDFSEGRGHPSGRQRQHEGAPPDYRQTDGLVYSGHAGGR